jgi:stage II sporulation protein D
MRALVAACVLALAPAGGALAQDAVRVALGEGLRAVDVAAPRLVVVLDAITRRPVLEIAEAQALRVVAAGAGLDLAWGPRGRERRRLAATALRLEGRRGELLRVGTRDYPGALEVWRDPGGLTLVNELGLEEYVAGTVRAEVSERWPREALRALAVVARTYVVFHQERSPGKAYHLVASSQHQNFAGRVLEGSPAWDAAWSTAGQVLTWAGAVFPAFYHSDSGGATEPARAVFSGDGIPPIPGVRDDYSTAADSPNATWSITLSLPVIAQRLRQGGIEVGALTGLSVVERSPSLRVARLAVEHSRGTAVLRGADFRRLVGYDVIKSTLFVPVVTRDGVVRFEGRGWGHGVGLSQFGAKSMAERGRSHGEILAHYYPGARLGGGLHSSLGGGLRPPSEPPPADAAARPRPGADR